MKEYCNIIETGQWVQCRNEPKFKAEIRFEGKDAVAYIACPECGRWYFPIRNVRGEVEWVADRKLKFLEAS